MGQDWRLCWPKAIWLPQKVCYTQVTAHSTPGGPDRSGRLWGEIGEPVQSPAAPGEDVSGELGAGRKVAEKVPWCLGLYGQQRVKN